MQSIFAAAFLLFGLVALFGIGITGLFIMALGAVFAGTAAITQEPSRAGPIVVLAVDSVVAYLAASKLVALFTAETVDAKLHQSAGAMVNPGAFDYLPPAAALLLIGVAVVAVIMDWRTLRNCAWF
ncbi:MAG TPA: hypothetical protein VFS02_04125 [Telluria sp.]|nr:hypothetical protein [Telluria sp.]